MQLNSAGSTLVQNNKIINNQAPAGGGGTGGGLWIANESDEKTIQNVITGNYGPLKAAVSTQRAN
jgi:hypothetical protein